MGYFRRTLIGVSWMGGFRIFSRVIAIARFIFLARILTPGQFGVFGIGSVVLSFLEILTETGINVILIQEKNGIDRYVNSAWTISIARGLILFFLIIMLSPVIVNFFGIQDLYRFLFLISLVPLIKGFINPAIVKFQKELSFDKEFKLRTSIFLFDSIVAITLAFITRDAISFVWGFISGGVLEVVLSFILFKPMPKLRPEFNMVKQIIKRGKWVTAHVIFNYLTQVTDTVVVGKILGASALGIYQMGYRLSTLPISEISDVANKVIFPVYTKIVGDKDRLVRAFKKTFLSIVFSSSLVGLFLFFLPEKIFILVLTEQWIEVVALVRVLAIYAVIRAVASIPTSLFLSLGKQNYVAVMTFFRFMTLVVLIVPFTLIWGIVGTGYSALFSSLMEIPLIVYFFFRMLRKKQFYE